MTLISSQPEAELVLLYHLSCLGANADVVPRENQRHKLIFSTARKKSLAAPAAGANRTIIKRTGKMMDFDKIRPKGPCPGNNGMFSHYTN